MKKVHKPWIAATGAGAGIIAPPLIGRIADISTLTKGLFLIIGSAFCGALVYFYLHTHEKE